MLAYLVSMHTPEACAWSQHHSAHACKTEISNIHELSGKEFEGTGSSLHVLRVGTHQPCSTCLALSSFCALNRALHTSLPLFLQARMLTTICCYMLWLVVATASVAAACVGATTDWTPLISFLKYLLHWGSVCFSVLLCLVWFAVLLKFLTQ
jgi:hypothetical protein